MFFRNYPNLLKLFPQDKYPDNLELYNNNFRLDNEDSDGYYIYIKTINDKIIDAIYIGQSLMKKEIPKKSDFENPESIIDFILEKISNLIRNNLTDNSKYYKILEDKLKNK